MEQIHFADDTISRIPTAAKRHKFSTQSVEGRRSQLYCMRSASVKSLNRQSNKTKEESPTSSSYSLNTMPATYNIRHKHQQQRQSFHHKRNHLQLNHLNYHQQKQQPHPQQNSSQMLPLHQQTNEIIEKTKLNATPSLRTTESALRR